MNPLNENEPVTSSTDATQPAPQVGAKVTVNGEEMEVIKVESLSDAATKVPTEPVTEHPKMPAIIEAAKPMMDKAQEAWENLVKAVIRKSKGLGIDGEVEIPAGQSGHYIKYAMDASGQYFSSGKGHGRRRGVRWTTQKAEISRIYNALFSAGMAGAFKAAQVEAEKASTPENKVQMAPITREKLLDIQRWAETKAPEIYHARIDGGRRKAARKRQQMARRQGFGLVAGNRARCTFTAA